MNKTIKKISPVFKDYLWGGTKLKEFYNKDSDLDIIAESWEVSTHNDGTSTIDGVSLKDYIEENPGILGSKVKDNGLPILIKLIDAKQDLSIQVHPGNEYARKYENDNGKTEMWYIVDAEEGSFLYAGVSKDLSKTELEESVMDGSIVDKLNKIYVKKGDILFIEPGTIHAIGKGIIIYEIQQRSNVTYRLYDFKRKDAFGNTRELHIDKSLEVSNLKVQNWNLKADKEIINNENLKVEELRNCEYFKVKKYDVNGETDMKVSEESCVFLTLIEGEGTLISENEVKIVKGDTVLIPAGNYTVTFKGKGEYLFSQL
ncbi:MAG: mannose-6-phosphate isomerase [Erysipelotrichaceae bacterium]|nr:mannose-6-phosphate isomerase [Erysipelotrichaceae bacterium]